MPNDYANRDGFPSTFAEKPPTWERLCMGNGQIFALSGDWIAQSGRIPDFPADELGGNAAGQPIAFNTANLGRWDTGLIEFLWVPSARPQARA